MKNNTIINDAIKLTASKMAVLAISMLTVMLLSRLRSLSEYGTYSQLILITNLFVSIFMLGLPGSINYFLAKAETSEEKRFFLSNYYTFSILLSVLLGILLLLLEPLLEVYFNNPDIKQFRFFLLLHPFANITSSSIENILIVYAQTSKLVFYRILNSLCLIVIIPIVQLLNMGFYEYMIFLIIIELIFAVAVYIIAARIADGLKLEMDMNLLKTIFKFSIPLGLATAVGTFSAELGKLVIGRLFDSEQLAIYTNASKEMPVTIIAASLTAVLMPQIVRLLKGNRCKDAIKLWNESIILSYIFICFFATVLFVFAPQVIVILYSEKYLPGIPVFRVYCLVLLLRVTYFGLILNSIGKTKFIFYSSIVALILNFMLNYAFYLIFGVIGPAIATLVAVLLINSLQLVYSSIIVDISLKRIFPWKFIAKVSLINGLFGIVFYFLFAFLNSYIDLDQVLISLALGTVWAMAYILLFLRFIKSKWDEISKMNISGEGC